MAAWLVWFVGWNIGTKKQRAAMTKRKMTKKIVMRMITLGQRMVREGFLMLKMMKGMLHSSSDSAELYESFSGILAY